MSGDEETQHVRQVLKASGAECTPIAREPDLHDPPIPNLVMTTKAMTPRTALELQSLFEQDPTIKVAWEECQSSEHSVKT